MWCCQSSFQICSPVASVPVFHVFVARIVKEFPSCWVRWCRRLYLDGTIFVEELYFGLVWLFLFTHLVWISVSQSTICLLISCLKVNKLTPLDRYHRNLYKGWKNTQASSSCPSHTTTIPLAWSACNGLAIRACVCPGLMGPCEREDSRAAFRIAE